MARHSLHLDVTVPSDSFLSLLPRLAWAFFLCLCLRFVTFVLSCLYGTVTVLTGGYCGS